MSQLSSPHKKKARSQRSKKTSIDSFDMPNFLQSGAIYAESKGSIHTWSGLQASQSGPTSEASFDIYAPPYFSGPEWGIVYRASGHRVWTRQSFLKACQGYLRSEFKKSPAKRSLRGQLDHETQGVSADLKSYKDIHAFNFASPKIEDYKASFNKIFRAIKEQGLKKAVPTLRSHAFNSLSLRHRAECLLKACSAKTPSFVYGVWGLGDDRYGYLGLTPEVLFRLKSKLTKLSFATTPKAPRLRHEMRYQLTTMALAGTQARGSRPSLLKSKKDLREHRFVVQDLRRVLGQLGLKVNGPKDSRLFIGKTQVFRLPTLEHLLTRISATWRPKLSSRNWTRNFSSQQSRDQSSLSSSQRSDQNTSQHSDQNSRHFERHFEEDPALHLAKTLHPTAALGVFPREFDWNWMRNLRGQRERRNYGAPTIFRISERECIALVNIRNIQWNDRDCWIESGGGVVADSNVEKEFAELALKRKSVFKIFFGEEKNTKDRVLK